jgi:hypothetical protein
LLACAETTSRKAKLMKIAVLDLVYISQRSMLMFQKHAKAMDACDALSGPLTESERAAAGTQNSGSWSVRKNVEIVFLPQRVFLLLNLDFISF